MKNDGIKNFSIPEWVESSATDAGGLDLLGLRNVAQSISNYCLNGITTISPQIRYLSIRSWITQMYAKCELSDDYSSFLEFGSKLESAVAIGSLLNNSTMTGIVGGTKAHEIIEESNSIIDLERLVQQLIINMYTGPSTDLGIAFHRESGITGLTKERGERLANAIMDKVVNTKFVQKVLVNKKVGKASRNDLIELGRILSISKIPDDERDILLEILMPTDPGAYVGENDIRRIATYTILLQLAQDNQRIPTLDIFFEEILNPKNGNNKGLLEIYNGWLCFLIRDSIAVAHEVTLQFVKSELGVETKKSFPRNVIIRSLINDSSSMENELRSLGLMNSNEKIENLHFMDIYKSLEKQINQSEFDLSMQRWKNSSLNELNLIKTLEGNSPGAVCLVPIVWLISYFRLNGNLDHDDVAVNLLSRGRWERFGLKEVIFPTIEKWQIENPTYLTIVGELISRTVDQHLRIAWSRLATDISKDVSIIKADGNKWQYKKDFYAGRTAPRIREAIGWLKQLKLINENGITSEGEEILNRGYNSLEHFYNHK